MAGDLAEAEDRQEVGKYSGMMLLATKQSICICLAFVAFLPFFVFSTGIFPEPDGYVTDQADILSASAETYLEDSLSLFEETNGTEIAVVTVTALDEKSIEEYAAALFGAWGIGKKGKDNGALLLIAPTEREMRIETGYGLEGTLTDLEAGKIIRYVLAPQFRENNYDGGVRSAVEQMMAAIGKGETYHPTMLERSQAFFPHSQYYPRVFLTAILIALIVWRRSRLRKEILTGKQHPLHFFHYFFIVSAVSTWIASWFTFHIVELLTVAYAAPFGLAIAYGIGKSIYNFFSGKGGGYAPSSITKKRLFLRRPSSTIHIPRSKSSFRGFGGGKSGGGGASGKW